VRELRCDMASVTTGPACVPVLCPRCGADRAVVLGVAEYGCGRCGATWPVEAGSTLPRPRKGSRPDVRAER
jgi:transposase-like protein